MSEIRTGKVRNGNQVPNNIYREKGCKDFPNGEPLGFIKDPVLAVRMVDAYNKSLRELTGHRITEVRFPEDPDAQRGIFKFSAYTCQLCLQLIPLADLNVIEDGRKEDVCVPCATKELRTLHGHLTPSLNDDTGP